MMMMMMMVVKQARSSISSRKFCRSTKQWVPTRTRVRLLTSWRRSRRTTEKDKVSLTPLNWDTFSALSVC